MENKKISILPFYAQGVKTYVDLSRELEDVFTEIPPYAKDEKGVFINPTSEPVLKKTGQINVQEKIQSCLDDVDIYKILERVAYSGDEGYLKQVQGVYMDIGDIPTDLNDFDDYIRANSETLRKMDRDVAQYILSDDFTEKGLNDLLESKKKVEEPKKEVKE